MDSVLLIALIIAMILDFYHKFSKKNYENLKNTILVIVLIINLEVIYRLEDETNELRDNF